MSLPPLQLPDGARVIYNHMSNPPDSTLLIGDILLVRLRDGTAIDVGWYPEDDAEGEFWIRAYKRDWDNQLLPEPFRTRNPIAAVNEVNRLAVELPSQPTARAIWRSTRNRLREFLPSAIGTSDRTVIEIR